MKSGSPSRTTAAHKTQTKFQAWSSLVFQCRHSSFYSFRSSSVGLETGEWRRCRSLSFTPPASLRSHGSRPRPTRHTLINLEMKQATGLISDFQYWWLISHILNRFVQKHKARTVLNRRMSTNKTGLVILKDGWMEKASSSSKLQKFNASLFLH